MAGPVRLTACLALIPVFLVCDSASGQQANSTIQSGTWVGGIGSLDDDTLSWSSAKLVIERDANGMFGNVKSDGRIYRTRFEFENGDVRLAVERKKKRVFSCKVSDGVIVASIDDGEVPNKLILCRIEPMEADRLDQLSGVYTTREGHRISFRVRGEGLAMTDFTDGMVRLIYPVGDDRFVAGPAIGIPDPVEMEFQFQRSDSGTTPRVIVQPIGEPAFDAVRVVGPRVEEFQYESFDGTQIVGSLDLPSGTGPFPAIVWVHGSGRVTRDGAGSWPHYFADLGFAVLAVDKRGVGKSGGKYSLPRGGRDNFPHMQRRSKDVAAAVQALRKRDDIQQGRIGLAGASQAGWVIPMATNHTSLAFAVILYGGATPLSVEGEYSRMASENASGAKLESVEKLIEELRSYKPSDIGIDKELAQMKFPCLWLYGYRDRSNPSQICEELINEIGSREHRDFTVKAFPNGNHVLLECRFGGSAESLTLSQTVPDLYPTIRQWLSERKLLPNSDLADSVEE